MINKDEAIRLGFNIADSKLEQNPLYENLKTNFPQTINADGVVSLKAIAMLLGLTNKADVQGYELTFSGKGLANALYSTPCTKELKLECIYHYQDSKFESEDRDKEQDSAIYRSNATHIRNTIIRGDNLDVLKLLKSAYYEKIKMIYIDPPYNTKNDNFIYPDDFRDDYQAILREVGLLEIDENGEEIPSETLQFFRNIQGSRTHSGWLCFMLPRLKLARDLLREDGVIFISIDDNEQANLKILCDEIFGEENFVANFIWKSKSGGANDSKFIAIDNEFIFCYAKNINALEINLDKGAVVSTRYNLQDEKGEYALDRLDKQSIRYSKSLDYEIKDNSGNSYFPQHKDKNNPNATWRWGKDTINERFDELVFKNGCVYTKNYKKDAVIPRNLLVDERFGRTRTGKTDLYNIFQVDIFTSPKPINLIKHFLQISTSANSNDIILDFFAGSGTTAQAVMELNAEDKGNRQFILVQLDEPINESKSKVAYDFCKNELGSENPTISDITIERVKRAGAKIAKEHKDFKGDLGFSVYSLCEKPSLVCDKEGHLELLAGREGISPSDIARNLSLQCGKGLDRELECIIESKLYKCDDVYCVVECDKEVLEILRNTKNEYIFIDGYASLGLEEFLNLKNSANIDERLRIVY